LRKYKNCFENLTKNVFTFSGELQNNNLLNGLASFKKPEFKDSLEKKGQHLKYLKVYVTSLSFDRLTGIIFKVKNQ